MKQIQFPRISLVHKLRRRLILNPLIRVEIIWIFRVWLIKLFLFAGAVIEAIVKFIVKVILVIIAALFLL